MAKRGKPRREPEIVDNLYCTIDGWQRTFRFGVNRFPRIEGLYEKEGGIDEWDHLEVFGTVRYHYTTRKTRKRTGQKIVLWVFPGRFSRDDYKKDPQSVGGVWTEEGKLLGTLNIPSDAFYSLFPCLAAGTFMELEIKTRNMRYRRGEVDMNPSKEKRKPGQSSFRSRKDRLPDFGQSLRFRPPIDISTIQAGVRYLQDSGDFPEVFFGASVPLIFHLLDSD